MQEMKANGLRDLARLTKPQAIVDRLVDFIAARAFSPGDQLPTEKVLMEALAVGRSSLREGIRKLEAMDIVQVRHGTGTFLKRAPSRGEILVPLVIEHERESLLQALDIRRALESHAAILAARSATSEQIDTIRHELEEMERVHLSTGDALAEDLRFHLAVYEAANNPLFEKLIGPVRGPFRMFFDKSAGQPNFGQSSFPLHRTLYEAIARRDAEGARLTTLDLLDCVEAEIRRAVPSA